jgi:SPP1 family phage portal protein
LFFDQSPEVADIYADLAFNAGMAMGTDKIVMQEVKGWLSSYERAWMVIGERYYKADPDILKRKRWAIGENGEVIELKNAPNNRLVNNFAKKLVDQKVGYLLSKPMAIQTDIEQYQNVLSDEFFNENFQRMIQNLGKEAINKGRAWLHVYYDEQGQFKMKRIPSQQIIPLWKDTDHTELDAVIRVYWFVTYSGEQKKEVARVEYWDSTGIYRFVYEDDVFLPDIEFGAYSTHFVVMNPDDGTEMKFNWTKPPFICFKYNEEEQPLLKQLKTLIDDYDRQKSDNANALEESPSDGIIILKNYDGTDLGEFRRNLVTYKAVKVSEDGGVDTINTEIQTEAFKVHLEQNRKDIFTFGGGVDTQNEDFGGDKSGVAMKFLYADLDNDCNIIETEFQWSLGQLLWFIDVHLANSGLGDFSNEKVTFIFNRDIIINETEVIENAQKSVGIISDETIRANHPWVNNPREEEERMEAQKEKELNDMDPYQGLNSDETEVIEEVEPL